MTLIERHSYFNDFLRVIEKKDLNYFGLAPGGKLNTHALKGLKLELSNHTVITYKNIIVHNEGKPVDFIFLSLKDYPCNDNDDKCGWLIDKAGSMAALYEDDVFVQYLINRADHPALERPNDINRTLDLSPFQDERVFEAQEANLNSLVFKNDFEQSTLFKKYIVKPGDNLSSIAAMHGIKLEYLKLLNNLEEDKIYVNQLLVLPK